MFGTQARGPHQVDLWTTLSHQVDPWAARDPHQVDLWAAQSHTSGPLGRFNEAIHIASTKATPKEAMVPSSMARQSALEFIEEKPRCSKVRQVWGNKTCKICTPCDKKGPPRSPLEQISARYRPDTNLRRPITSVEHNQSIKPLGGPVRTRI